MDDVRKYEIYFEFWLGYLTSEQSEQVRYLCSTGEIISYIFKHSYIVLFII